MNISDQILLTEYTRRLLHLLVLYYIPTTAFSVTL